MSKKNIVEKVKEGKVVRLTFETRDGVEHTYEYKGNSAAAVKRGRDPKDLKGVRVSD
jgi:hypothetical protein